jgi:hypothetical protein
VATKDRTREIEEIPEDVFRTLLIFLEIAHELLCRMYSKRISFQGFPNCHGTARVYAQVFNNLEVVDGALATYNVASGIRVVNHSWLRFSAHPKFGIDVSPIGSVPFMSHPNLLYFDQYTIYQECSLPEDIIEIKDERCEQLLEEVRVIVHRFSSIEGKAA